MQRLGELESNMTISLLIVYIVICATYLCFYQTYVIFSLLLKLNNVILRHSIKN